MPSVKWATGTRHKARGTTKAAPAKNRVLGPASREPEVVAKEQLRGVSGRAGRGGVCNTYITDFAPRACPRFWRCISAWEVGSVFWPKTIVRNAIFARRIRNSFRSSSKCYAGGGRLLWQLLGLLPQTEAAAISTSPLGYATPRPPEPIPSLCSLIRYPFLSRSLCLPHCLKIVSCHAKRAKATKAATPTATAAI